MSRREVRLSGFGGQGIILSGKILGMAAAIYDGRYATFTQSYGPEARGGACAAEVVINDTPVHYPHIVDPEVLVVMSQGAYNRYAPLLRQDGMLIIDSDLVELDDRTADRKMLSIPSTRIAEEVGRKMVANIVMLGFIAAVTNLVSVDAMREAALASIPPKTIELNTRAFNAGLEYGQTLLSYAQEQAGEFEIPLY
ncbi:MAG: 2-oxoacid:acceptor oxidoreductase family protein [Anaerolineales bacterium]|nr:2-oxoacid:acceptor oxidoreductase family protein [Anaerolineales bacterium]